MFFFHSFLFLISSPLSLSLCLSHIPNYKHSHNFSHFIHSHKVTFALSLKNFPHILYLFYTLFYLNIFFFILFFLLLISSLSLSLSHIPNHKHSHNFPHFIHSHKVTFALYLKNFPHILSLLHRATTSTTLFLIGLPLSSLKWSFKAIEATMVYLATVTIWV